MVNLQAELVADLIKKIKNGEASHQEKKVAVELLKNNSINVSINHNSKLSELDESLAGSFEDDLENFNVIPN